jgi:PAS domain S-box-containing protein
LTDLVAGSASMKANTAVALMLQGVGLVCFTSARTAWQRLGQLLAAASVLIAAATAVEYLLAIDLGIDQLLVVDSASVEFPGRMAPPTAACFLALGLALCTIRLPPAWMSQVPALFVAVASFVVLIGYGYGTETLYSFGPYGSIAVQTALAFLVLAMGVIAARDHDGITGTLRSAGPGGQLARRFLPLALLLPAIVGWFRLIGQEAGLYDTPFGVAIFAVTLTVILLIVTVRSASWIDRADLQRQRVLSDLDSARRETLEREINLAAVVDSSDDAIVGCSVTGTIRTWNGGAERLYGYSADEAIGQPLRMLVPPELHDELQGMMAACLSGETIRHVQTVRIAKNGTPVDVSISAAPIRSAAGAVVGLSAIARDIREQLQILRKLESQTAELQRSNDELTQFASVASHDLQEPLRMVASYAELLASRYQGQLDERADKYIVYISDGASRMQRLIRELLNYARVGTRAKSHEPVDLNEVMRHVLRDLHTLVKNANAEIVVRHLPTVLGDDVQLGQVLQNLVGNAIKFHANRPPLVTVDARRDGGTWRVTVEDNGIGIDMKFHDRVFEIFRRLHDGETYQGTGVGLAIVKRIVERHGGRVWFESTPGHGTRFHFTISAPDNVKEM